MRHLITFTLLLFSALACYAQEVPKPEFPNLPYIWNKDTDELTVLVKETVDVKADEKTSYKFYGATAKTKMYAGVKFSILIDSTNPTLLKAYRIYKLDVKGKTRQVTIVEAGAKGEKMRDEYVIDYNLKNVSGGIHELVISRPLDKGEYTLTSGSGSSSYTFSVQ